MKKNSMKNTLILITIIGIVIAGGSSTYSGNNGDAGVDNLFNVGGVGARALGLGNAYVAMPLDATAIYWNPAGMEYIQKKSLSLFYTNLLAGAQYNFVGYVHPTINLGTFGIGVIRLGVGDITERDDYNMEQGTFSHSQSQFLLSYAKQLPYHLSAGISLKLEQWSIYGLSDSGIGADIGFLYRPNFSNIILRNISVGMNIKDILEPRIKLYEKEEKLPFNIKMGFAKPLSMSEWGSQFTLFLDFEQGGGGSHFKYHTGTEYVFQDRAMLRVGMNDSYPAFGAGVVYNMFQLDYSYGKFAQNDFDDVSHRISMTINFGKSKDELIRIAEEKRFREIDQQVQQKIEWDRNEKITGSMEAGKRYMDDEDWLRARQEFTIILGYENEIPDAIEIKEAKDLLKFVEDKYEDEKKRELAEIQARDTQEREQHEKRIFVNEQHKKALTYYEHEDFDKAIAEWKKIIERYPENEIANEFIKKAQVDYSTKIYNLIKRADDLGKKQQYVEAITMLSKALELNPDDPKIRDDIASRKVKFENQFSFWDLYRQGRNYEIQKEYKKAMEIYERAMELYPNNAEVKKHYEDVKVRAFARREPMKNEVKTAFLQSLRLINVGKYEDALKILEEIQKIQPYNKEILDAIDTVLEKINQQKRR